VGTRPQGSGIKGEPVTREYTAGNQSASPTLKTADWILAANIEPTLHIVPGLITEGLTIISGPPKIKKSYLLTDIATAVVLDACCLENGYRALSGSVLYLDFEDDDVGEQLRLKNLFPTTIPSFGGQLFFEQGCSKGEEGFAYIESWIKRTPNARLIVIDTLSDFRPPFRMGAGSLYDQEKAFCVRLNRLALRHHIAIVCIHHNNKGEHADLSHKMSGTEVCQVGPWATLSWIASAKTRKTTMRSYLGAIAASAHFASQPHSAPRLLGDGKSSAALPMCAKSATSSGLLNSSMRAQGDSFTTGQIANYAGLSGSRQATWKLLSRLAKAGKIAKAGYDRYQSVSGCQAGSNPPENKRESNPDNTLTDPDMSGSEFESYPDSQAMSGSMSGSETLAAEQDF
jgi:hypothetical protein